MLLKGLDEIGVIVRENGSLSEPVYFYVSGRRVGLVSMVVFLNSSVLVTFVNGDERKIFYENLTKLVLEREFDF